MSSDSFSSLFDNFLYREENNNFLPSFIREYEEFESFSKNSIFEKERIDSINEINSSLSQIIDLNVIPSLNEVKNIIIPNSHNKENNSNSEESSLLFNKVKKVLIPVEEKKFLQNKRCKERRPRKDYNDNIRVKIKRRFLNHALKDKLNNILKKFGCRKCFDFFPKKFSSDIDKVRNKRILNMTLNEIYMNKELYKLEKKEGLSKYNRNLDVVESGEIKNNGKLQKIFNKTFSQLYEEYINSDVFNIDEINRLKKKYGNDYIERYKILSINLIYFFSN